MIRRPPRSTRTDTLFPYTTLFRSMLVNDFAPDEVFLLPLYPQFSTTTTGSSVRMWREACRIARLDVPTRLLCCYPTESRFIATMAAGLRVAHAEAAVPGRPRVLFSAIGRGSCGARVCQCV